VKRAVAVAAFLLLCAAPVRADEVAALGNVLAVEQLVDVLQTRTFIGLGGHEADPFTRPFVRSTPLMLLGAAGLNVLARRLAIGKGARTALLVGVSLYPVILEGNARYSRAFGARGVFGVRL